MCVSIHLAIIGLGGGGGGGGVLIWQTPHGLVG